jgi:NadR type nicotinamide-nucleotide adenylyltransferase
MQQPVKKVALIGPESSGKTTLARQLAAHFSTQWVPEFARGYVSTLGRNYTLQDIQYCAREQLQMEDDLLAKANRFLFCDSELIIAKVWCEDVFKTVPAWIDDMIRDHPYDLFLLTRPDIPFQEDDVRENPHRRDFFFDWYKRELDARKFNYEVIGGIKEERFSNALAAIGRHFPGL